MIVWPSMMKGVSFSTSEMHSGFMKKNLRRRAGMPIAIVSWGEHLHHDIIMIGNYLGWGPYARNQTKCYPGKLVVS